MVSGTICGLAMNSLGSSIDLEPPAPAEPVPNGIAADAHPFRAVCANMGQKLSSFLEENVEDEILRSVQKQTRASLATIQEALLRYPYASPFSSFKLS